MAHNYELVQYSRSQIKKAGKLFVSPAATADEKNKALVLINNWRAAHAFPLQVIYVHLKKTAPSNAIVAQRLKRLYSITQKLYRFPNMSLTAMQDIGGCRVIVETIDEVYSLVEAIKRSQMRHEKKEEYDYIKDPKPDGYRSYHLVLSYQSDRNTNYNGLFIEVQVRTHLQHVWATAVETMDTFTGDPLKIGRGSAENRQFFLLVSRLFECYEKAGYNPDAIKSTDAVKELKDYLETNNILQKMKTIQTAAKLVSAKDPIKQGYYVMRLNYQSKQLLINTFPRNMVEEATDLYDKAEKERDSEEDVVLVSTASFVSLQQAYPNYFTDIREFVSLVESFIS